ncbi:MAG TPA: hypothetical protein DEF84_12460, partial [Leclercia adecarboxylata]|nr:hypothetical protein [Leclercia adecarboxylata]
LWGEGENRVWQSPPSFRERVKTASDGPPPLWEEGENRVGQSPRSFGERVKTVSGSLLAPLGRE